MVVTHGALTGRSPRLPPENRGGWALTIGNFDGVHRGHRALLDRVMARGREHHLGAGVLTFEPHPREFFASASGKPEGPSRITRLRDKLELMAQVGIDRVHVARFDARLASLPAPAFVEEVLVRALGTRWLIVGRDFRYGKGRAGD